MARPAQRVEMIPIDRITIVNPRLRSKKIFKGIVENIAEIGLKRPITVTRRQAGDRVRYDVVCGEGRPKPSGCSGSKRYRRSSSMRPRANAS